MGDDDEKYVVKSKEYEDSDDGDEVDQLQKKYFPKHKKRRVSDARRKAVMKSPLKESDSKEPEPPDISEQEINVKIPTSEDTDVVVKVKPLDDVNIKNKRIHIRVNQKKTPESTKKSKKIVYGTKSVISHHLRKSRPPMFSRKLSTPKLGKKQIIERVIEFTKQAKRDEESENDTAARPINKELLAKLECQRIVREKRTKNAQLKKLMNNL